MLYPAKTPVLIYNMPSAMCRFFLPIPSHFLGVPIQFVSNLKSTQMKRKGKACLECVPTPEGVTLEWDEGWMTDRAVSGVHHEARREESRVYHLMLLS